MKKRILTILLLLALLTSCGGTANETTQTETAPAAETETETTDPAATLDLPDTDWEGRQYRILGYRNPTTANFCNFEIDTAELTGEVVNDAIYTRNSKLEEKYNTEIVEIIEENGDISNSTLSRVRQDVQSGDDLYELMFATLTSVGSMAQEGLLYDLYTVDNIDFTKNWYSPFVNDTVSVMNRLYFTSSDFSLRDKNRVSILIINDEMTDQYNLGEPVALVDEGTWTYDVMTEWAHTVAGDTNGNGTQDMEDTYGIGIDSYNSYPAFVMSCGIIAVTKDADGKPALQLKSEQVINALDKILLLTTDKAVTTFCNDWEGKVDFSHWSVSGNLFKSGHSLFTASFPASLETFSADCEFEYSVLPYPKYDTAQDGYYSMANSFCMLFGIPVSCKDPAFAGFMLEAISHASTDTTLKAFYDVSCKTKYSANPDSARMLDLIFDGILFEPAQVYGLSDVSNLYINIGKSRSNNFASAYAGVEKKVNAQIEQLIEKYNALP